MRPRAERRQAVWWHCRPHSHSLQRMDCGGKRLPHEMEERQHHATIIRAFPEVELRGGLIYFLKSNFMPDAVDDICCRKKIIS